MLSSAVIVYVAAQTDGLAPCVTVAAFVAIVTTGEDLRFSVAVKLTVISSPALAFEVSYLLLLAIETEDNSLLEQMPGIGSRAAQKIIASLNGKLTYQNEVNLTDNAEFKPTDSIFEEALSGLISLGYKNNEARNAINEVLSENEKNLDVENIVREVLKKNTRKYV